MNDDSISTGDQSVKKGDLAVTMVNDMFVSYYSACPTSYRKFNFNSARAHLHLANL